MGVKGLRTLGIRVVCGKQNILEGEVDPGKKVVFGSSTVPCYDFASPIFDSKSNIAAAKRMIQEAREGLDDEKLGDEHQEIANMGQEMNRRLANMRRRGRQVKERIARSKEQERIDHPVLNKKFARETEKEALREQNIQEREEEDSSKQRRKSKQVLQNIEKKPSLLHPDKDAESEPEPSKSGEDEGKSDEEGEGLIRRKKRQGECGEVVVEDFEREFSKGNTNDPSQGRDSLLEKAKLRKYTRRELALLDLSQDVLHTMGMCSKLALRDKLKQIWLQKDPYFLSEAVAIARAASTEGLEPMRKGAGPRVQSVYSRSLSSWGSADCFFIGQRRGNDFENRCKRLAERQEKRIEVSTGSSGQPKFEIQFDAGCEDDSDIEEIEMSTAYLLVVNIYSRHAYVTPLRNRAGEKAKAPTGDAVRRALVKYSASNVLPLNLFSDNGTEFRNKQVLQFAHDTGRTWHYAPSSSPRSSGIAERRVQAIKLILERYSKINAVYDLEEAIHSCVAAINSTPSKVLGGWCPNNIQFGSPLDPCVMHRSIGDLNNNDEGEGQPSDSKLFEGAANRASSRMWFAEACNDLSKGKIESGIIARRLDELKQRYVTNRGWRIGDSVWISSKPGYGAGEGKLEGTISGICRKSFSTTYFVMLSRSGLALKCGSHELSLNLNDNLDWELPRALTKVRQGVNISELFKECEEKGAYVLDSSTDVSPGSSNDTNNDKGKGLVGKTGKRKGIDDLNDQRFWTTLEMFPDQGKTNFLGVDVGQSMVRTNQKLYEYAGAQDSSTSHLEDGESSCWMRCDRRGKFRCITSSSFERVKGAKRRFLECRDTMGAECSIPDDHLLKDVQPRPIREEALVRVQVMNKESRRVGSKPKGLGLGGKTSQRANKREYSQKRDQDRAEWTPKVSKTSQALVNKVIKESLVGGLQVKEQQMAIMGEALRNLKGITHASKDSSADLFNELKKLVVGVVRIKGVCVVNGRNKIISPFTPERGVAEVHLLVRSNVGVVTKVSVKDNKPIGATQVSFAFQKIDGKRRQEAHQPVAMEEEAWPDEQFSTNEYALPESIMRDLKSSGKATGIPYSRLLKLGLKTRVTAAVCTEFRKLTTPRSSDGKQVLEKLSQQESREFRDKYNSTRKVISSQLLYDCKVVGGGVKVCVIKCRLVPIGWQEGGREAEGVNGDTHEGDSEYIGDAQGDGIQDDPFSSPTLSTTQLRILFQHYASLGKGRCATLDIRRAFLQSHPYSSQSVRWVAPPFSFKSDPELASAVGCLNSDVFLCRIPLYGLKPASISWYYTMTNYFSQLGFESAQSCPSVFMLKERNVQKFFDRYENRNDKATHQVNPHVTHNKIQKDELVNDIRAELGDAQKRMGLERVNRTPIEDQFKAKVSRAVHPGGAEASRRLKSSFGEHVVLLIAAHVDDLIIISNNEEVEGMTISAIGARFDHGEVSNLTDDRDICYCGKTISRDKQGILISTPNKARELSPIEISDNMFKKDGQVNELGIQKYRSAKGVLRLLAQARPEVAYQVFMIARGSDQVRDRSDFKRLNKVIRYIKENWKLGHRIIWTKGAFSEQDELLLQKKLSDQVRNGNKYTASKSGDLKLSFINWRGVYRAYHMVTFSDAALRVSENITNGRLPDKDRFKTVGGYVCGCIPAVQGGHLHPLDKGIKENFQFYLSTIDINTTSLPLITSSSYCAEAKAMKIAIHRSIVLREELLALNSDVISVRCYTDSDSILSRLHSGEAGLRISEAGCYRDILQIKLCISLRECSIHFVNGSNSVADFLAKYCSPSNANFLRFQQFCNEGRWTFEANSRLGKVKNDK